ncbi:MAG: DUF357 domain-containing protein [Candidatus Anstonellaceae archaeon]
MEKKEKEKEKERIESDIEQFYQNLKGIKINQDNLEVIELAKKYCEDSKYWLKKEDYLTAFGCINYAHGLIDAFRLNLKIKK